MFLEYLEVHGTEYEQVLVTDTRDVIFQGDVFSDFANQKDYLGYALEADNIRAAATGVNINYRWLTNNFGKAEADLLADKKIICCGTVIGTVEEMKIFLQKMDEYIPNRHFRGNGNDQVTQQYLTYHNLLPIKNLIPIDCHNGAILTAYLFFELNPIKLDGNKILRGDGKVPAVVHQYDRHPSLVQLVNKNYRDQDIQPDERFTDAQSAVEQISHLVNFGKNADASRFFMNHIFGKMDLSNYVNDVIKIWRTLLLKGNFLNIDEELLVLAIQYELASAFSRGIDISQIQNIYVLINYSMTNNYLVSSAFKNLIANGLFNLSDILLKDGDAANSAICLEQITTLDIPLDQNFYMRQSEVYRKLNRKAEAVAAYQKALEFD